MAGTGPVRESRGGPAADRAGERPGDAAGVQVRVDQEEERDEGAEEQGDREEHGGQHVGARLLPGHRGALAFTQPFAWGSHLQAEQPPHQSSGPSPHPVACR